MIRLLESAATRAPAHVAVITPEFTMSFGELLDGARRVASELQRRGVTRFAIVEQDVAWVLQLLAGSALAGVEPCQYQADIAPGDFATQAAALGHAVLVTRRTDLAGALEVITPDALVAAAPAALAPAGGQPLMIRTTGTTGLPKAARHDWRRLEATIAAIEPRPEQRWLMAYGPHQFAGLQVLQHVLACQATLVAPFPRQPRNGLAALHGGAITCVSATPTYWRFLLAEARSSGVTLPPLQQITLGGEASPPDLLDALHAAFPAARISQVYASTEFGSVASVTDGLPGFSEHALHSDANPDSHLKLVDGELWVRTDAGMFGYAGEADTDAQGWRPTGDLVQIADGRVLFRGRTSETINVGGVKVHPLPVENRILALDSVGLARVFGRPNRLTGAIVAAEVVPQGGLHDPDLEGIRRANKAAVADLPPAWHPRSVTFVEAIQTRGEKTVRGMDR